MTNPGTIRCNGYCSATTPADSLCLSPNNNNTNSACTKNGGNVFNIAQGQDAGKLYFEPVRAALDDPSYCIDFGVTINQNNTVTGNAFSPYYGLFNFGGVHMVVGQHYSAFAGTITVPGSTISLDTFNNNNDLDQYCNSLFSLSPPPFSSRKKTVCVSNQDGTMRGYIFGGYYPSDAYLGYIDFASVTTTWRPTPLTPAVILNANASPICSGGSVSLSWDVTGTDITSCTGDSSDNPKSFTGQKYAIGGTEAVTPTQIGNITYTLSCTNPSGTGQSSTTVSVQDCVKPTCGSWTPNPVSWTNTTQTFTLSGSTDTGGSGINVAGGNCSVSTNGGTCNVTISDHAGNTTTCTSPAAKIDKTAPTCGSWAPSPVPWTNTTQTFTLSGSTDTGGSGINVSGGTCTVNTNGGTCNVTISDHAGNTTTCTSPAAKIDQTPPTCSITYSPNKTWSNVDVLATATCSDTGGSGCTVASQSQTFTHQPEGYTSHTFTVSDNAGNSGTCTSGVQIDKTNPETSSLTANPSTWTNQNVTISGSCSDQATLSGVKGYHYKCTSGGTYQYASGSSINFTCSTVSPLDGSGQTASAYCEDNAGNTDPSPSSVQYYIDTTAPTVSATPSSQVWTNQLISITLHTSDSGGSGLKYSKYIWDKSDADCRLNGTGFSDGNSITLSQEGQHTLYLCNEDNAGNQGSFSGVYKYDIIPPVMPNMPPSGEYYVPITFPITDSDSGIKTIYEVKEDYNGTYTKGYYENIANNCSSYPAECSIIDNPNITINDTSGPNGSSAGTYAFIAKDVAGNQAVVSRRYKVTLIAPLIQSVQYDEGTQKMTIAGKNFGSMGTVKFYASNGSILLSSFPYTASTLSDGSSQTVLSNLSPTTIQDVRFVQLVKGDGSNGDKDISNKYPFELEGAKILKIEPASIMVNPGEALTFRAYYGKNTTNETYQWGYTNIAENVITKENTLQFTVRNNIFTSNDNNNGASALTCYVSVAVDAQAAPQVQCGPNIPPNCQGNTNSTNIACATVTIVNKKLSDSSKYMFIDSLPGTAIINLSSDNAQVLKNISNISLNDGGASIRSRNTQELNGMTISDSDSSSTIDLSALNLYRGEDKISKIKVEGSFSNGYQGTVTVQIGNITFTSQKGGAFIANGQNTDGSVAVTTNKINPVITLTGGSDQDVLYRIMISAAGEGQEKYFSPFSISHDIIPTPAETTYSKGSRPFTYLTNGLCYQIATVIINKDGKPQAVVKGDCQLKADDPGFIGVVNGSTSCTDLEKLHYDGIYKGNCTRP
jgi:hypothetical protein